MASGEHLLPGDIPPPEAYAAFRTRNCLIAARLVFVFFHGLLIIITSWSLRLGWKAIGSNSWFSIGFYFVWFGDALSCAIVIYSWFASCSYVSYCLEQRQARMGNNNPSILTDILPSIVMAIMGLVFLLFALWGEVWLYQYLANLDADGRESSGNIRSIKPAAAVLGIAAVLGSCHGVCIRTNGWFFNSLGFGALATCILALCVPGGLAGRQSWVILIPSPVACLGILLATVKQSRQLSNGAGQERKRDLKRLAEQCVLILLSVALVVLICLFASPADPFWRASAGAVVGAGICVVAILRALMLCMPPRPTSAREFPRSQPSHTTNETVRTCHSDSAEILE